MARETVDVFLASLGFLTEPGRALWWGYLLSASAIAVGIYAFRRRTLRGFARSVIPRKRPLRRAWHDIAMLVLNATVLTVLFLPTVQFVSTTLSGWTYQAATAVAGSVEPAVPGPLARGGMTVAAVVAADAGFFASHWLQHRIGALWEFHKVHHSAQLLLPFTVGRRHPVDVLVESFIVGVAVGATYGLAAWTCGGAPPDPYRILGTNALLFGFFVLGFNLQHSHVWVRFGPLDRVFISPAAHQIHHSTDPRHYDRNFGNVLSLWDQLCGTFVRPAADEQIRVGLGEGEDREYERFWRLYAWPFAKLARRLVRRSERSVARRHPERETH